MKECPDCGTYDVLPTGHKPGCKYQGKSMAAINKDLFDQFRFNSLEQEAKRCDDAKKDKEAEDPERWDGLS